MSTGARAFQALHRCSGGTNRCIWPVRISGTPTAHGRALVRHTLETPTGLAQRRRCLGIRTTLQERQSDPIAVDGSSKLLSISRHDHVDLSGFGDADPLNVSPLVRGAGMRVAETRAVNRALRKAYGIGMCSVEELGCSNRPLKPTPERVPKEAYHPPNGPNNGQPRLRDQALLADQTALLDPTLVKAYAADFAA